MCVLGRWEGTGIHEGNPCGERENFSRNPWTTAPEPADRAASKFSAHPWWYVSKLEVQWTEAAFISVNTAQLISKHFLIWIFCFFSPVELKNPTLTLSYVVLTHCQPNLHPSFSLFCQCAFVSFTWNFDALMECSALPVQGVWEGPHKLPNNTQSCTHLKRPSLSSCVPLIAPAPPPPPSHTSCSAGCWHPGRTRLCTCF